jgi:hypothetical protein
VVVAGVQLAHQLKVAAVCGTAAGILEAVSCFLDLVAVWQINCADSDVCKLALKVLIILGFLMACHAYLSLKIASRARILLSLLDPVTSGLVHL